jgi:hypothetical protein
MATIVGALLGRNHLGRVALVLSLLALVVGGLVTTIGGPLDVRVPSGACEALARDTRGVVRLELARTESCAKALVDGWRGANQVDAAVHSVMLDFLFLALYTVALFSLSLWVRSLAKRPYWRAALRVAAGMAIVTALLDASENIGLLRLLLVWPVGPSVGLTFWLASAKFVLFVAVLLVISTAWIGVESQRTAFLSQGGTASSPPQPSATAPPPVSLKGWVATHSMYVWPLRVPLIAAGFLIVFPLLLRSPEVERYASGLFDPLEAAALLPIAMLALLCAWTLAIMTRLILMYGQARLALPPLGTGKGGVPGSSRSCWIARGCPCWSISSCGRSSSTMASAESLPQTSNTKPTSSTPHRPTLPPLRQRLETMTSLLSSPRPAEAFRRRPGPPAC